jgi:hypothetical protein
VPVPLFCYFCISEKLYRKYSQNWTKQNPNLLFSRHEDRVQSRDGGGHRGSHTIGWRPPLATPPYGVGPSGALWHYPSAYKFPLTWNPKRIGIHPRIVPQRRRHRRPISGDRSLCSGTLPGWGIAPGAISIDSTAIFIAVADSHDEEWVVLPRGWGLYR